MTILVVAMPDLALKVSCYVGGARYVLRVSDGKELRHRVYEHQPEIVLLDWRLGGNAWRALDEVTAIVERTQTHPFVVALLPETSRMIEREAARLGCYDVLNVSAEGFASELYETMELAIRARRALRPDHRRVTRASLH